MEFLNEGKEKNYIFSDTKAKPKFMHLCVRCKSVFVQMCVHVCMNMFIHLCENVRNMRVCKSFSA